MGRLTTHVLDTALGRPAAGIAVALHRIAPSGGREKLGDFVTNADGRCDRPLLEGAAMVAGTYELIFDAGAYFDRLGLEAARAEVPGPGGDPLRHRRRRTRTTTCRCCSRPTAIPPTGAADERADPPVRFLLGDEERALERDRSPTLTVLDYLRRHERRIGTKEGCARGRLRRLHGGARRAGRRGRADATARSIPASSSSPRWTAGS